MENPENPTFRFSGNIWLPKPEGRLLENELSRLYQLWPLIQGLDQGFGHGMAPKSRFLIQTNGGTEATPQRLDKDAALRGFVDGVD